MMRAGVMMKRMSLAPAAFRAACSAVLSDPRMMAPSGRKATVRQFVPANHFSSFAAHVVTHPFHKVTLQVFFIVQIVSFFIRA